MRTLLALLTVLILAAPALAQPDLPKDREVPMVRNEVGDPTALPNTEWHEVDSFQYGRCGGLVLSDGARGAVILYRMPVVPDSPAVFYVIYDDDDAVVQWAGSLQACDPDSPEV